MSRIKAITFDLDGVYFPKGKEEFLNAFSKLGVPRQEVDRVFVKSDQMANYKKGKIDDAEFWSWLVKQWKLDIAPEQMIDLMLKDYQVDQNVKQNIRKLRNIGYKILACSNNFPARIHGLDKKFSFLNDFDEVVLSYEVGETKPSVKIFRELINKAAVRPSEIVLADDKSDNVKAAQDAGITAFIYEGLSKFLEQLMLLGVKA